MNNSPLSIGELLEVYRRTHYGVTLPNGSGVTLHIGTPTPQTIADWIGISGFAAFLTACNPRSARLTDANNAQRMSRLRARLAQKDAHWLEGEGSMPREPWCESSLLVTDLDIATIDELARDFGQNAVLIVARDRHIILRMYRREWRALVGDSYDVEWADPA